MLTFIAIYLMIFVTGIHGQCAYEFAEYGVSFDFSALTLGDDDALDYYTLTNTNPELELTYYFNFCEVTKSYPVPECQRASTYCNSFNTTGWLNSQNPVCLEIINKPANSSAVAYQIEPITPTIDECWKLSSSLSSSSFQAPYATYSLLDAQDPGDFIIPYICIFFIFMPFQYNYKHIQIFSIWSGNGIEVRRL